MSFYAQSILNGFREVEDALVDQQRTGEQLRAQEDQLAALQNYARLTCLRYDEGYSSYLEVLDSERSPFATELDASKTRACGKKLIIFMYKKLLKMVLWSF